LLADGFEVLGTSSNEFDPHGYTLTALLAESHATIHTYPEYDSLYFHLYSCRGIGDGIKTFEFFKDKLKPKRIDKVERRVVVGKEQNP